SAAPMPRYKPWRYAPTPTTQSAVPSQRTRDVTDKPIHRGRTQRSFPKALETAKAPWATATSPRTTAAQDREPFERDGQGSSTAATSKTRAWSAATSASPGRGALGEAGVGSVVETWLSSRGAGTRARPRPRRSARRKYRPGSLRKRRRRRRGRTRRRSGRPELAPHRRSSGTGSPPD